MGFLSGLGGLRAPRPDYKSAWDTWQGWYKEDRKWYEDTLASTKANLASTGYGPESRYYQAKMDSVETQWQKKLDKLTSGETFKTIRQGLTDPGGGLLKTVQTQADIAGPTISGKGFNTQDPWGALAAISSQAQKKVANYSVEDVIGAYSKKYGNIEGFKPVSGGDSLVTNNPVNQVRSSVAKQSRPRFGIMQSDANNPWI